MGPDENDAIFSASSQSNRISLVNLCKYQFSYLPYKFYHLDGTMLKMASRREKLEELSYIKVIGFKQKIFRKEILITKGEHLRGPHSPYNHYSSSAHSLPITHSNKTHY